MTLTEVHTLDLLFNLIFVATEFSLEEAIKVIDDFLQNENLSPEVETLLGDLKTLITESLSLPLPGVSSRSDVTGII